MKYLGATTLGCKDIGIIKSEFVAKTQILYLDVPKPRNGVVVGTFEDLSQEEKTRAFLQLLEYKLKVEKVNRC